MTTAEMLRREGRDEGRQEGEVLGKRGTLLLQLRQRFGRLPAAASARIDKAGSSSWTRGLAGCSRPRRSTRCWGRRRRPTRQCSRRVHSPALLGSARAADCQFVRWPGMARTALPRRYGRRGGPCGSIGGCSPAARSTRRSRTTPSRFRCSAATVALPRGRQAAARRDARSRDQTPLAAATQKLAAPPPRLRPSSPDSGAGGCHVVCGRGAPDRADGEDGLAAAWFAPCPVQRPFDQRPRDRSTLLVRLMAAGPGLAAAVGELAALPDDAHERTVEEAILLRLQSRLFKKPARTPEEEEFIVALQSTSWKEARALGRDEGLVQGEAHALLTVLRGRGISVPDSAREQILAEKDPARLERWIAKASIATSLTDVLDEPSGWRHPTRDGC